MIEIKNLYKNYGEVKVLKDINLEFKFGKVYGLLGRNGVGKTTLLRIMANQIMDFQGNIIFENEKLIENQKAVEEIVLIQNTLLNEEFLMDKAVSQIFTIASIVGKNWDFDFQYRLIKEFSLNVNKEYGKLSKGNQNIVRLIIGLCNRTKVVIFDEPNTGLDANNRYLFYEILMEDLEKYPRTVIISSHIIDELESFLEEIIILKNGQVLINESLVDLQEKSLLCIGREDNLSILENKNIIHKKSMGALMAVAIYDNISQEEKYEIRNNGVEISRIPLQKLFTYLTN